LFFKEEETKKFRRKKEGDKTKKRCINSKTVVKIKGQLGLTRSSGLRRSDLSHWI